MLKQPETLRDLYDELHYVDLPVLSDEAWAMLLDRAEKINLGSGCVQGDLLTVVFRLFDPLKVTVFLPFDLKPDAHEKLKFTRFMFEFGDKAVTITGLYPPGMSRHVFTISLKTWIQDSEVYEERGGSDDY